MIELSINILIYQQAMNKGMVDGAIMGSRIHLRLPDQFATGNKTLVNHKTYYFMALAYA